MQHIDKLWIEKPEAVLFDWDNTLVDTFPAIRSAFTKTCEAFPTLAPLTQEKRHRSVRETFPELFGNRWEEAHTHFYQLITSTHLESLILLPGARELIQFLHRQSIPLAVISNKKGEILRKEIDHLGLIPLFSFIAGAGDCKGDKPSPEPALEALAHISQKPSLNTWVVGDSIVDWECANLSGCRPVAMGLLPHTLEESKKNNFSGFFSTPNCEKLRKIIEELPSFVEESAL